MTLFPTVSLKGTRKSEIPEEIFLSDPGVPGVRSMGPDVSDSLTDYVQTLADDDSNSIPTDDVNKAMLGNVAI